MFKYLIEDLTKALQYVPAGIMVWLLMIVVVKIVNNRRKRQEKQAVPYWTTVHFFSYLILMLVITFLSRETGSSSGIDLQIGSSMRINNRNNALVVENVLLFIPYGFLYGWWKQGRGFFFRSIMLGFVTSLGIESLQLVTGRGIFQLDDIITNTLGCLLGALVYKLCNKLWKW